MSHRIYLSSPHLSEDGLEMGFVREAFESNWIAPLGQNVDEFEKEIAEYIGVRGAVALNTGTSAIHLALIALDVGVGDIVFCQSLTFVATCNPIIYQKAIPVFIDSDFETWNMCPAALEGAFIKYQKLGKLPKAVIVVHVYGLSADLDKILEICKRYNVPLIEDAAESLGTKYKGKYTGGFGNFGIFSFNGNKIITTSGGGMIVSDDVESLQKVRFWASQSRNKARHYEHSELGYNYRMSNVLAGIGRGQLRIIKQRIDKKKSIFEYYKNIFTGTKTFLPDSHTNNNSHTNEVKPADHNFYNHHCDIGYKKVKFSFMPVNEWCEPNYWLSCVIFKSEEGTTFNNEAVGMLIDSMEKDNIEARPLWKPMHLQPFFKEFDLMRTGVADALYEKGLCLPSDTKMNDEDLKRVVKSVESCFFQ